MNGQAANYDIAVGILIALAFILAIVVFTGILIQLYINKIRLHTKALYQKDLDTQKAINVAVMDTQESVLSTVSQELHDDAGQQLTYINFQLENLRLDSRQLHDTLEPVCESVTRLSQSIRSISHHLNIQIAIMNDIVAAISGEAQRISASGRIEVQFRCNEKEPRDLPSQEKVLIYRIFQESVNNILKHSGAKSISIDILTRPYFSMAITDDGKGFDPDAPKVSLGIIGMRERAKLIDYKLTIKSGIGSGTAVTLSEK